MGSGKTRHCYLRHWPTTITSIVRGMRSGKIRHCHTSHWQHFHSKGNGNLEDEALLLTAASANHHHLTSIVRIMASSMAASPKLPKTEVWEVEVVWWNRKYGYPEQTVLLVYGILCPFTELFLIFYLNNSLWIQNWRN